MALNGGVRLFQSLVNILKSNVDDDDIRYDLYYEMIDLFEQHDCILKTLYEETEDATFDKAISDLYPELLGDEEE